MKSETKKLIREHTIKAKIERIIGSSIDGKVILKINDISICCFLPDYSLEGWGIRKTDEPDYSLIGKEINVILLYSMFGKVLRKTPKKMKRMDLIPFETSTLPSFRYSIEGVIVDIHEGFFILDCGIPICVAKELEKDEKLGSWIAFDHGRLDALWVK